MILFPGCKINLGLRVLGRRPDGYHNIESVMVPVGWTDILEILPPTQSDVRLICTGRHIDCPPEKNLVIKAYRTMQQRFDIHPVDIVLEKIVPDAAGLGGGSADAAATIVALNRHFGLSLDNKEMARVAASIGADCPFFVYNRPMLATDTGTTLTAVDVPGIKGLTLLIVKPESVSISTAAAYAGISLCDSGDSVLTIIQKPVEYWQNHLVNDFESSIFPLAPEIKRIKETLLASGAVYASMSGSGSAVFGLFKDETVARQAADKFKSYPHFFARL